VRDLRTDVVVTGGGTAGHLYPALAIAQALVERGHRPEAIFFVGARRGLERTLLPPSGFPYVLLPGRGIVRRLSLANLVAVAGLAAAFCRAIVIVGRRRPGVVVSVGGYGGVACSLAAKAWGIPIVTVNVDAVVGAANRLIGRFAHTSAVAFDGTGLPRAVVTGVPVRAAILAADQTPAGRARARGALGVGEGRHLVVIVGGSLGARRLNDAAVGLRRHFADRVDLAIHHICGAREYDRLVNEVAPPGVLEYRLVGYEAEMPEVLCAADLVVGRAGAMTVAELRVIGVASILVPLPGAPGDHQQKNAEALGALGAAVVVPDAEATAERLAAEIDAIVGDRERRHAMAHAAHAEAAPNAAVHIAQLIDEVAAESKGRR
jgi:UDP-N-acetylglucosamine--N-acetylmuramyl-(pentapeptide) pyrophosphoryl-undecaprenol N-acetylglucosamine transferase